MTRNHSPLLDTGGWGGGRDDDNPTHKCIDPLQGFFFEIKIPTAIKIGCSKNPIRPLSINNFSSMNRTTLTSYRDAHV